MAKNKSKIKINFVGTNSSDVTGSCIHIETPSKQILLECGLYQTCGNNAILKAYKVNNAHFKFKPKDIDYVFVNHCHVDHCGNLGKLYKNGCNAPVIMPKNSQPILEILLRDSAKIMSKDAEELSYKFERHYNPIFDDDDVDNVLDHYTEYDMNEIIELDEHIKFRFTPSGHILNAAQLELWITEGNITKKIAYTSDLGNVHFKPLYANTFEPITQCNYFIGETTYAGEEKIASSSMREKDIEKIRTAIEQTCVWDRGRMLIPSFANQRTQMIMTILYDLYGNDPSFKVPILVDSPMAIKICDAYTAQLEGEEAEKWQKVVHWKNIRYLNEFEDSKAWRDSGSPAIIIASSGMLVPKTRALAWASNMVANPKDRICFVGYSAEESIASIIKEGKQKNITIGGKKHKNRCQVTQLRSFSSHMQRDSLLKYYSNVDCEKIILVHGETDSKLSFAEELRKRLSKNNKTSKVVVTTQDYSVGL